MAATGQRLTRKVSHELTVLKICGEYSIGPESDTNTHIIRIGRVSPSQLDLSIPWLGLEVANIHGRCGIWGGWGGECVISRGSGITCAIRASDAVVIGGGGSETRKGLAVADK